MIIAVNISKAIAEGKTVIGATHRAWTLDIGECQRRQFVIGVINGNILGYFRLLHVTPDSVDPSRIAFDLAPCNNAEITRINNCVQGVNLRYIRKGKYIDC